MRDPKQSWQKTLAQGFATAEALLSYLGLPAALGSASAETIFRSRIPRGFAARMNKGDARDPLLLQVLASPTELLMDEAYVVDPLEEKRANVLPGLLHKYQGRVLLTLTGSCAVNCRFCFRRHFPYQDNRTSKANLEAIYNYIRADSSIHEVILSGGDPLVVTDHALAECFQQLAAIPHLKSLRFHSRIPVVLPERITQSFVDLLSNTRLRKVMVLHCNHPQEINHEVEAACQLLKTSGCQLLNQSVLLKGVNDEASVLALLSERLFDCGVLPYYLHLLDKVQGTKHYDLPEQEALRIYRQLQTLIPGYLLPRLSREEAGKTSKTLIVG